MFYVQYAHARVSGILRNAQDAVKGKIPAEIIDSPEARELAVNLIRFPEAVGASAVALEPHRIPQYLENLASVFHRFYNLHRVISDDAETTSKRIQMVKGMEKVLQQGLALIGVSAPERM